MSVHALIQGLPIRLTVGGLASVIQWRDGEFVIAMGKPIADTERQNVVNVMYAHELGHIVAAQPWELIAPNLGMPIPHSRQFQYAPEDVARVETVAMGTQLLFDPSKTDRMLNAAKCLFKIEKQAILDWMADWNLNRVREALRKQCELAHNLTRS